MEFVQASGIHTESIALETDGNRTKIDIESDMVAVGDTADTIKVIHIAAKDESNRNRTYSSSVVEKGFPARESFDIASQRHSRSYSFSSSRCLVPNQDQTIFFTAISRRDYKRVRTLLMETPRLVKCIDEFSRTPLHIAAELGDKVIAELLLQYNADCNAVDARQRSCLYMCADADMVKLLCEEGIKTDVADKNGYLPLHAFILDGCKDCAKVLIEFGCNPMIAEPITQRNSIHLAADSGDFELLSALILNSSFAIDVDAKDIDGNTALHLLAMNNNASGQQLQSMMLLLDKGASVELANKRGITALHYACGNRFFAMNSFAEPIIQILLEMSADPNARDNDNCTPLIIACAHREWEICRLLFEAGGDMNIPCPMSSYMLQEGFGKDIASAGIIELEDCTASDLMQRQIRPILFSYICVCQTDIPLDSRDRCMNCANVFEDSSRFSFSLVSSSNSRVRCRFCGRVTCVECNNKILPRHNMPAFIIEAFSDREFRVCDVCYSVLNGGLS